MERQVTWPVESRRNKQQSPTSFPPLEPRSASLLFVKTCRRCARLSLFFVQITTALKFHSKLIHPLRDCMADTSSVHVVSGLSASVHLIIGVSDIRLVTYGPTCSCNKRKQSCTTRLSVCLNIALIPLAITAVYFMALLNNYVTHTLLSYHTAYSIAGKAKESVFVQHTLFK